MSHAGIIDICPGVSDFNSHAGIMNVCAENTDMYFCYAGIWYNRCIGGMLNV